MSFELGRVRKSWQSLSRQDKTIVLMRLNQMRTDAEAMSDSQSLVEEIDELRHDIRSALGIEATE
jgi:hypothetical protein